MGGMHVSDTHPCVSHLLGLLGLSGHMIRQGPHNIAAMQMRMISTLTPKHKNGSYSRGTFEQESIKVEPIR